MQRYGSIIGVKKEKLDDYKYHHAHIWPEINAIFLIIPFTILGNYCSHIMNIQEMTIKQIWTKWRQTQRHRSGGIWLCLSSSRLRKEKKANGGRRWKRSII